MCFIDLEFKFVQIKHLQIDKFSYKVLKKNPIYIPLEL